MKKKKINLITVFNKRINKSKILMPNYKIKHKKFLHLNKLYQN